MRNPSSRDAAAADLDAATVGDATALDGVKRLFADFERLKAHVDSIALRERIAQRSMSIMTAYLAGEMPPEAAAQVEELLRTEPLLRETYAGLVAAWQAPNAEREVTSEEVDAGYARFKAKVAAKNKTSKA
jgi:hypothetical protein